MNAAALSAIVLFTWGSEAGAQVNPSSWVAAVPFPTADQVTQLTLGE